MAIFGRRIPLIEKKPVVNPLLNEQNKVEFGVKQAFQDKGKNVSLSTDMIFRDLQFFIPELIITLVVAMIAVGGTVLGRFIIQSEASGIKKYMSDQAFNAMMGVLVNQANFSMIILIAPLLVLVGLFMFKWLFFHPRGSKVIVLRSWKTGMERLSIERIKDNKIRFDSSPDADEIIVGNVKKNWEYSTGRPLIHLEEGVPENTYLHRNKENNELIRDSNNVRAGTWAAAVRWIAFTEKKADQFFTKTNILILIVIIVIIIIAVFLFFRMSGGTEGLMQVAQTATQRSG